MFALCQGTGTQIAFPDVCQTVVGLAVAPIPYPNVSLSALAVPTVYNVLYDCLPAVFQGSKDAVSSGDEPGTLLGVASFMAIGQTSYEVGCVTIFTGGLPQQRLTSITGQNGIVETLNTVGASLAPSQVTVLTLG